MRSRRKVYGSSIVGAKTSLHFCFFPFGTRVGKGNLMLRCHLPTFEDLVTTFIRTVSKNLDRDVILLNMQIIVVFR